jgi:hypothetical protein
LVKAFSSEVACSHEENASKTKGSKDQPPQPPTVTLTSLLAL